MKTNQELLDFYGVEIGKKYKITDQNARRLFDMKGTRFSIKTNRSGFLEVELNNGLNGRSIHMLEDYVYEEVKEPLTEKEKAYLSAVIKPFRDSIITISKMEFVDDRACIRIKYRCYDGVEDRTYMPVFNVNDLYLSMEADKEYTLEELGL